MTRVAELRPSHGHAERFDAVLWVNDAARSAWEDLGEAPDGAVLVEQLSEPGALGVRGAGRLVMAKSGGAWRFSATDEKGALAEEARTAACAVCHREAPRDFVFVFPPGPQSNNATPSAAMTASAPTSVAIDAATYDARSAGPADAPSSR